MCHPYSPSLHFTYVSGTDRALCSALPLLFTLNCFKHFLTSWFLLSLFQFPTGSFHFFQLSQFFRCIIQSDVRINIKCYRYIRSERFYRFFRYSLGNTFSNSAIPYYSFINQFAISTI